MDLVRIRSGPVRVCHIAVGDLWAGAEVQLATLLSSLVQISGFEFSAVLLNKGRLANELSKLGIKVMVVPENSNSSARILSGLAKHFRENTADIIHTHKPKDNVLGAIAGKLARVPHIIRLVHGLPEPFHGAKHAKMALYEFLDGLTNKYVVSKLVAVSLNLNVSLGQKYGVDKVVCIHNGVDLENLPVKENRWDKRRELHIDENSCLVGTVGRLTQVKGQEILLRAASLLLKERNKIKFLIVGDGPLRERLQELATQLGIDKDVVFAGHRDDVYDLVNAMDVFVLPSLHEGIPMVLLEALALQRPVVASRVGGIPEVIEHGISGLLVPPGDVQELAQSLATLLDDRPFAEALAKAGRRCVEEEFDVRVKAQEIAQVYRALVFE